MAAPLPVNANEIDLAAQCIAARAPSEEILRLVRETADDIGVTIRLNAQYGSKLRTSLSVLGCRMRVQAVRQKREATEGAANQDAWTRHATERSMLEVADMDAARRAAARIEAARRPRRCRQERRRRPVWTQRSRTTFQKNGTNPHAVTYYTNRRKDRLSGDVRPSCQCRSASTPFVQTIEAVNGGPSPTMTMRRRFRWVTFPVDWY